MAKAKSKNTRRESNTAEKLAAIRWLAMKIEQVSIEILVTDRDKFETVEASLRDEVNRLKQLGGPKQTEDDDCPEGYVLCHDGLCAPMCGFTPPESSESRKHGKGKP